VDPRGLLGRLLRGPLLGSALAAALVGCPERQTPAVADRPPEAAAEPRGLRVDLPEGWTARVDADGALLLGPAGRAVLRIARLQEPQSEPSLENLEKAFVSELPGASIRDARTQQIPGGVLWFGRVVPRGGSPQGWPVMLGTRRVDEETLLCATLPGASAAEVADAARLCEHVGPPQP
jgi:hypothetical protein